MHYFLYMFDHFCVSSSQDAATFFRDRCLIWHSQCRRRAVIWRRCVMAESMERMVIEGKSTCQRPKPQRSQGHGYSNLCWFVDILRFHCIFSMIPKSFGLCGWVDQGHVWRRKFIRSKCCISWGLRRSPQMCAVTEVTCLMQATSVLPVQLCRWVSVEIANRISQDPIPTASRIVQAWKGQRVKDLESTCYVYINLLHL